MKNEIQFVPINNSERNAQRRAQDRKKARKIAKKKKQMRQRFIIATSFVILLLALSVTITILCCQRYESVPISVTETTIVNNGITIVEATQDEMEKSIRESVNAGLLIEEIDEIPKESSIILNTSESIDIESIEDVDIENENETNEVVDITYFDVPLDEDLQNYIFEVADKYGMEPSLIISVIDQESDFIPTARSNSGDSGLMQVNDINLSTLKSELGIDDIYDPYQNVLGGTYILAQCMENTDGDVQLALMCYNMGLKNARKCWANGIYSSEYSRSVYYMYTEVY